MKDSYAFPISFFTIRATGTGPNADAIAQALEASVRLGSASLEIRAAPVDGGEVLDRIRIGYEANVERPAWRFLSAAGSVAGPGSYELSRGIDGPAIAAARLMHHCLTRAHQVRRPDHPVPWIFYVEPEAPVPLSVGDRVDARGPAPGVYSEAQAREIQAHPLEPLNLDRFAVDFRPIAPRDLAGQSLAQMFDDMRHELARIAVALGRSSDGTGLDCDWHDLAGDVETLAVHAPFKLPRRS